MKRLLILVLVAVVAMLAAVLPAAASEQGCDAYLVDPYTKEQYRYRYDEIDDFAFQKAAGILTLQLSSGNGNILQANTRIAIANADVKDLVYTYAKSCDATSYETYLKRGDYITGSAFQFAAGIITLQMSCGNGNILQSNVNIEAKPWD